MVTHREPNKVPTRGYNSSVSAAHTHVRKYLWFPIGYGCMSDETRSRVNLTISDPLRRYLEMRAELTGKSVATIANEILSASMVTEIDRVAIALSILNPDDTNTPTP